MSRRTETIPPAYFDALYQADPDPWQFRTSSYEREKYADTLQHLRPGLYARALEIGCANGVFTRMLAPRCGELQAIDGSVVALAEAQAYCRDLTNVRFRQALVPDGCPPGPFDLIVLSEVLYYLVRSDLSRTAARCIDMAAPGADIVLCHWLGETDYPLTGDEAAEAFVTALVAHGWHHEAIPRKIYRLDVLRNPR